MGYRLHRKVRRGIAALLGASISATLACGLSVMGPPFSSPTETPRPTHRFTATSPTPADTAASSAVPTADSPSGSIVYTCQVFADRRTDQLCTIRPQGGSPQRVTHHDAADHIYPSWAPDGEGIVFSSNRTGMYEVYSLELGGAARQLTHHGRTFAPTISPDGRQLVYTVRDGESAALWSARRDGTRARWLIGEAWDAAWSPDGAWILHASDRGGSIQLWMVRPDGTGLRQVTSVEGLRGRSDWSPDGDRIATYAGTSWSREIISLSPEGEDLRQLTHGGNNLAPTYSPSGEWIAFTSYMDHPGDENGCEIYIMRADGTDVRRLTQNEHCDWQPRWSR